MWVGILGVLTSVACGGTTCTGSGGAATYVYPDGDSTRPDAVVQDGAVHTRITQGFLDFIQPQLPTVLRAALGSQSGLRVDANGVLHVPLPSTRLFDIGVAEATLAQSEALLWLDDLEQRLELRFETPNHIRLVMRNLRLGLDARLQGDIVQGDFSCPITGDLGAGPVRHAAEITIDAIIDPGVGPRPAQLLDIQASLGGLQLDDLDLRVLGSGAYCAEAMCSDCLLEVGGACLDPGGRCVECDIACGGITSTAVGLITGLLDLLRPLLNDILRPAVQGVLGDTLQALNGQPAKFEGQMSLADLGGYAFLPDQPMGFLIGPKPGRFPVSDRNGLGMEVSVSAGAEGPLAECARGLADFVSTAGPVPELTGVDSQGRAYHMAASLSESFLDQVLYAAHRSGSLCLALGSEDVLELTGGSFTLDASLLSLIADGLSDLSSDQAPVIVELKPREPGDISFGSGAQTGMDAMGNPIYDWQLQLGLQDLGVAFHVLIEDRYVRVFEVTADAFVGLGVVVLPDNRLELALGELRIDGFEEVFNELLPDADFATILPSLLDIALGALTGQPLTFDLDVTQAVSDILGGAPVGMRVNDIFRDGAMQDYLTASVTFTSSGTANALRGATTVARLADEAGVLFGETDARAPTGQVRLQLGEGLPADLELEYQVRARGGLWSIPRAAGADGTLEVALPRLRLAGRHELEVRARAIGAYETLDLTPVVLSVEVDPFPPTVGARQGVDGLEVWVRDGASDPAGLSLRLEADGSRVEVALTAEADAARAVVPYPLLEGARLRLVGVDAAGNESAPLLLDGPEAAPWGDADDDAGASGCRDLESDPSLLALLLSGAAFALSKRRRRSA